jgi:type IV pilus assembly protein PilQ
VRRLAAALLVAAALGSAGAAATEKKPAPKAKGTEESESQPRFVGEEISLDLKDADLKDVLATFSRLAKINIAVDPEVKGSVTIRLQDVPWDQALDVILRVNGYGYVLEGNVLRVGLPSRLAP